MKKLSLALLSSAAVLFAAAPTFAADLRVPPRAPAYVPAPVFTWNGFYIGAHIGGGWSDIEWQFDAFPGVGTGHSGSGGLAGLQIGYNWQMPGSGFVLGVELDGSWADITGSRACPNPAFECGHKIDRLASLRGRVGYAAGPALFYFTGGGGYGSIHFRAEDVATGALFGSRLNKDGWGWTFGGGIEYAFANNWSAKIEYLHYAFEGSTAPAGVLGLGGASLRADIDTLKAGINYRFNFAGGPVVANY